MSDVGLLLIAADGSIESANAAARAWLTGLDDEGVVRTVADRARHGGPTASERVRTRAGRWALVRGAAIGDGVIVMFEALRPPELAPLIADAAGLTDRERAVTRLVARGLRTADIARRLIMSPYTVQDHLKAIFDKVGVHNRGELVARLYFDHDTP